MRVREHGRIVKVEYGQHEHYGIHMLQLMFDFGGSVQSFQSVVLDLGSTGPAMCSEICALFHVKKVAELKGRSCYVLRCWPELNEPIEGFEVDGKRWTQNDFVRRYHPDKWRDRLTQRSASIRGDIDNHARRIREAVSELATLSKEYVDWSTHPIGTESQEKR
jgi:hypothetical protein